MLFCADTLISVQKEAIMPRSTLTLSLPREIITKAKILAAQRQTSLSQLFARSIEDLASQDAAYLAARDQALHYLAEGFDLNFDRIPREEWHDRAGLR